MKRRLILISVFAILLATCTGRLSYNPVLVQADSLMQSRPDSALWVLENFPADSLKTKADRAYYALLITKARDKNYVIQKNDSLIQTAVQYYDSTEETQMQAQAYYYWGGIYRDRNEQAKAIEKYLWAAPLAQEAGDKVLLGRIYANAAYIYYLQRFYDKADSIYQRTEQISIQLKDTFLQTTCLTAESRIQLYQNNYSLAEKKLLQALAMLKDTKQNGLRANIFSALSSLYVRTGNTEKALQYAKQNIHLQEDTLHCYRAFLELGDAYFHTKQHDSATIYLRKSLPSSSYSNKESAYMRLAEIAKAQGDMNRFVNTEDLFSVYKDSANLFSQRTEIIEAQHAIEIEQQQARYERHLEKSRYNFLTLFLATMVVAYFWRKRYLKKMYLQKRESLMKEEELHTKYILVKEEVEKKEKQISVLQQEMAKHHINEEQREAKQKELMEMNHQYTELLKKILSYSDAYNKLKRIILDCKEYGHSKESLSVEEWDRFMLEIDKNGTFHQFAINHNFEEKEIHNCYLVLAGFSNKERMQILQISRATLYRVEQKIFIKIGVPYQPKSLPELLKDIVSGNNIDN